MTALAVCLSALSGASVAQADDLEINANISVEGLVSLECPAPYITNIQTFEGIYPTSTRLVSSNLSDTACENGNTIEGGYLNEAGDTPDGNYFVVFNAQGETDPDYRFNARKINGQWFSVNNYVLDQINATSTYQTRFTDVTITSGAPSLEFSYDVESPDTTPEYSSFSGTYSQLVANVNLVDACQLNPGNPIDGFSVKVWDNNLGDYLESNVITGTSGTAIIDGVNADISAIEIERYYLGVPDGTCDEVAGDYETTQFSLTSSGGEGVTISTDYFLELSEFNSLISEKNPTLISYSISQRPGTTTSTRGENLTQTQGTGTLATTFTGLADGTYDVYVKFSNTGCQLGLSACPFPLAYLYTSFTLSGGTVTNTGIEEIYTNTTDIVVGRTYEDCSLTKIGGCINNSLRFLFVPSNESIMGLIAVKDDLDTRIPFVYVSEIREVADEIFNTAQAQDIDVVIDTGFGELTFFNREMIENAPYVDLLNTLLSASLWLLFALAVYRIALGTFNHNNQVP